ncbi:hypothetical protein ACQKWADRAFT_285660 [Trichoderma austrokoningii]
MTLLPSRRAITTNHPSLASMEQSPAAQEARDCVENQGQKRKRESTADENTLVESPVAFWAREGFWPPKYKRRGREHILAQKCPTESVLRDRMEGMEDEEDGESDCWPHEQKFTMYRNIEYKLDEESSFIGDSLDGADPKIMELCRKWLKEPQQLPDRLESGVDFFEFIEQDDKTELDSARLFSSHMLPYEGVQILATSFYRGWNSSVPLSAMRPQPDLTVGFALCELTQDQLNRLHPFLGDDAAKYRSFFMATDKICFPFLTYEMLDNALDEADLMNAHSMTLAVRGVIELFRLVNRQHELHRQILGFSLSHDCTSVRIYGHYAEIDGGHTTYYRHEIHSYTYEYEDEEGKWAAHRFVKNVYEKWVPGHYERICSAINQLPSLGSSLEALINHKWDPISQLDDAFAHIETE